MAGPLLIPTRRFLFVRTGRKVTLAPIYIALLGLLALGLLMLGLIVAVRPPDTAAENTKRGPVDGNHADDSRSFEGSYLPPPAAPKPRRSGTWM